MAAGTALMAGAMVVTVGRSEGSRSRAGSTCLVGGTTRITTEAGGLLTGSLAEDARRRDLVGVDLAAGRCRRCRNSTASVAAGTLVEGTSAADTPVAGISVVDIPEEGIRAAGTEDRIIANLQVNGRWIEISLSG